MKSYSKKTIGTLLLALLAYCGMGGVVFAGQIKVDVSVGSPFLKAGEKQTTYLKVGLTGFELARTGKRTPVNVAIVIDRSGSMGGDKIRYARDAAIQAIARLGGDDIVSVIAYDTTVSVIVPATKIGNSHASINEAIGKLAVGSSTALFAGVSKGAEEVRKFFSRDRVNRIILLSDGLANVGPSTPGALGDLGSSLGREGIAVTTLGLGLGYNEDLMAQLAGKSDGTHAFIEHPRDLARIFDYEFRDVLSVVAQEVAVRIKCAEGVRPVRGLGRSVDINGQIVTTTLNQLYSKQEKYIMLEIEVPAGMPGTARDVAEASVTYLNMGTKVTDKLTASASVRFTNDGEVIKKGENVGVMVEVVTLKADETNRKAVLLRDQGRVAEAAQVLTGNNIYLGRMATRYQSKVLEKEADFNKMDAENLEGEKYLQRRKDMNARSQQHKQQQSYK